MKVDGELRLEMQVLKDAHIKAEVKHERELHGVKSALEIEFRHKFEVKSRQALEKSHAEQFASFIRIQEASVAQQEVALRETDNTLRELIEERFDQLGAMMAEMDKVDDVGSEDTSGAEESNVIPDADAGSPKQSQPGSSSANPAYLTDVRQVKKLHFRVLNLEKQMVRQKRHNDSSHRRPSPSSRDLDELNLDEPSYKNDVVHEAHLRLVVLLKETQELRELLSGDVKTSLPDLRLEAVPNIKNYVPYMTRLQALEDQLAEVHDIGGHGVGTPEEYGTKNETSEVRRVAKAVKDLSSQVQRMQADMRRSYKEAEHNAEQSTHDAHRVEEPMPDFSSVADTSIEQAITRLQEAISRISSQLNHKVSKSELEKFLRVQQTNILHSVDLPSYEARDDTSVEQLQERLNRYWFELKELQKNVPTYSEMLREEMHERLKQLSNDTEENMNGVHSHLMAQIADINEALSLPVESSESSNLAVMRALNARLQKDVREIRLEINELSLHKSQSPALYSFTPVITESHEEITESPSRNWGVILQKHEASLKSLQIQIQSLNAEFETQQSLIKKTQDQQLTQSIKQLEELRTNVSEIMMKLSEGSKLNQRDLEKLNELYRQLEGKSDREEILQKVDKRDLNRAYRFLSKKIESLSKDVERTDKVSTSHVDEPAAVRKKLEAQCLACGKDISPTPLKLDREWRSWGRFPPNVYKVNSK